jgi:uncharacterized protein (TIGR02284 family)
MENQKAIDVLNPLIVINNDRIEGYETAAKETEEQELKTLFAQMVKTSQKCKQELIHEVHKLNGTPDEGTRTTGKFFRAWMDVKAALTGKDRKTILDSCEYGEDAAKGAYEKALEHYYDDLTPEQISLVKAQHLLLKADHDKVKSLRDMAVAH